MDLVGYALLFALMNAEDQNSEHYTVHDKAVYYELLPTFFEHNQEKLVKGADPKTFKNVTRRFGKDKEHVFFEGAIIKDADPNSIHPIKNDDGACADDKNVYVSKDPVENANPKTFHAFADGYEISENNVYYEGKLLEAKAASFHLLISWSSSSLEKAYTDENHVYIGRRLMSDDPKNFKVVGTDESSNTYLADKKNVFYRGNLVEGADARTFKVLLSKSGNLYCADASKVYLDGKELPGLKPDTTHFLGDPKHQIVTDGHIVFEWSSLVADADPTTYHFVKKSHDKVICADKNFQYEDGSKQIN